MLTAKVKFYNCMFILLKSIIIRKIYSKYNSPTNQFTQSSVT